MSTADITLTTQEKKELEKRGFFVLKNTTFFRFLKNSISIFILSGLITGMLSLLLLFADNAWRESSLDIYSNFIWKMPYVWILICILMSFYGLYTYAISSKLFYSEKWILGYGLLSNVVEIEKKDRNLSFFSSIIWNINAVFKHLYDLLKLISFSKNNIASIFLAIFGYWGLLWLYQIWLILWDALWINESYFQFFWYDFIWRIGFALSPVMGVIIIWLIWNFLIHKINPLYAFGNLGEKIQSLIPQIATQSKAIEQNFASDMNYRILSDGFDGLASTFSQIVSLVIRLERVEARANKGNLFDSERYISSLRSDIVWPLRSLRNFLDTRRTELTASHEELSRVRVQVGGTSENRDLASARTEPLMAELTENIDQLDVMIEKMG